MIPFNKPYLTGKEMHYISKVMHSGKLSGNGAFSQRNQKFFENTFGFKKTLMTTSCTDALEMAAILAEIQPGDEVIVPSYTFVSSALAFVRLGAKIVFADSRPDHPGIDEDKIESLITSKTKVIVPVHYAGVACDMDKIMDIAEKYNLLVIEDAAQAIDSYYKGRSLGSIGHMSTFSFHETKNINSGEGGLLAINDDRFINRAEIIWEKGTNRAEFFRGEVNKYGWVDTGSSFLPSEIISAFLWAQLEDLENIQSKRRAIWELYYKELNYLENEGKLRMPYIPDFAINNGHMFYLICNTLEDRTSLIKELKDNNIMAVFHYLSLHNSEYYLNRHDGRELPYSELYTNRLIRLPFYYNLSFEEQMRVIHVIKKYYK